MAGMRRFEQRRRNTEQRKRNPFVIIGCEGKNKTEKLYFKNFNSRQCMIKFSKGNSTDPKGIVEDIIRFIKNNQIELEENDKVYAVFDTDVGQNKQQQIEEAKILAEEYGVEIITSTPAFEIWFLLHFGYTTKAFVSNKALQDELEKQIPDYSKSNNTYLAVKDLTGQAIENAKRLEQYQINEGQALDSEYCNPYTGVYKVTEELINRNKEK